MNTEDFLRRVIPPGNHAILSYNKTPWAGAGSKWSSRAFAAADIDKMAAYARFCAGQGWDTYHALAAFRLATAKPGAVYKDGSPKLHAERKQTNVQALKAFWIDIDVKRDHDGKKAEAVFATRTDALAWLFEFCTKIKLPRPNLLVDSGYGFHAYWLLDAPVAPPQWYPLAGALKEAMLQNAFRGDAGISTDSARILRPPGAKNFKGPQGTPGVPVEALDAMSAPDYTLAQIEVALAPFVGMASANQGAGQSSATGHGATFALGAKPIFMNQGAQPQTNANAQANLPPNEYLFANVAANCLQVAQSLANHGDGDSYPLWYRGNLSLAHFCTDGANYTHEISKGDPRYTPAGTDAAVARIAKEVGTSHGLGAPRCTAYNDYRRGVCGACPWWGRLNSPISLGRPDGDLPDNYRRYNGRIERHVVFEKSEEWLLLVAGDVYAPRLEEINTGGFALSFTYALSGAEHYVRIAGADVFQPLQHGPMLERQGVPLDRKSAGPFGDFVMAWITKLRSQRAQREDNYRPFGWCNDQQGDRTGLAVAGTLYRTDGSIEAVPGGDAKLNSLYRPHGSLANWRRAAALFEGANARQDLHAILAISFGSPLISLVSDVRGMSWHFWSVGSAVGKSSMMKVAQAVWADVRALSTMDDTPNAVMRSLSGPRVMPRLWDEMRVKPKEEQAFSQLVYNIPQGREKARMGPDTMLRETGEWETMVVFTSNRSLMDLVIDQTEGTDSGMARLFEAKMPQGNLTFVADAGETIKLTEANYGHAGREFARYVTANLPAVQKHIRDLNVGLAKQWGLEPAERFYLAGCVAALTAAEIAKKLNLFDFDIPALYSWLTKAFMELRRDRNAQPLHTRAGGTDIEQLLSAFYYEMADFRLVTNVSSGGKIVDILDHPRNNEVRLQVIGDEQILRINLTVLRTWLQGKHLSSASIIKQMIAEFPAKQLRKTIGAGTRYRGGQLYVLDVDLRSPALRGYLPDNLQTKGKP
jgi:hypothetical protein